MKWVHRIVPILIVVMGLGLLYPRFNRKSGDCAVLCREAGTIAMNIPFFESEVVRRYPRIRETPVHLVVFMDPVKDCAACLFEMQEWVQPLRTWNEYGLSLFVPDDTPEEVVQGICEAHGLGPERILKFEKGTPLAQLNRLGVFKVFYSQERRVEWYETGNQTEESYRELAQRIAVRMQAFGEDLVR